MKSNYYELGDGTIICLDDIICILINNECVMTIYFKNSPINIPVDKSEYLAIRQQLKNLSNSYV